MTPEIVQFGNLQSQPGRGYYPAGYYKGGSDGYGSYSHIKKQDTVAAPTAISQAAYSNDAFADPLPDFKPGFRSINPSTEVAQPTPPPVMPDVGVPGGDIGAPPQNPVPTPQPPVSQPPVAPQDTVDQYVPPVVDVGQWTPNVTSLTPALQQAQLSAQPTQVMDQPIASGGLTYGVPMQTNVPVDPVNTASSIPVNSGMNSDVEHNNIQENLNRRINMSIR